MKLSKIYSNFPKKFRTVLFNDGLNVVQGTVKTPRAKDRDTHNLGKTLFAQVIDFCLLRGRDTEFFLFKEAAIFEDFVFFLEIRKPDGQYVTVRRSVRESSKSAFKTHKERNRDFVDLAETEWDHWNQPFDTSRKILDGILDLKVLGSWSYRQAVSYSLRSQRDYDEPFKLAKHAGVHSDWKPFLAHILGFNGEDVEKGYALEEEISKLESEEKQLVARASGVTDPDQLRGQLEIAEQAVRTIAEEIDRFDFSPSDRRITRTLVSDLDITIKELNEQRYSLLSDKERIESALGVHLSIDIKALQKIFKESKVYFSEQVVKDFDALEEFNRALAEERDEYLRKDLVDIEAQLVDADARISDANQKRSQALASLTDVDSMSKYKRLTKQLVDRQTDFETLRRLQTVIDELTSKRKDIKDKKGELEKVTTRLDTSVKNPTQRYKNIRKYFDDIVFKVIDRHANLFTRINGEEHLEFKVHILDDVSKPSSAGKGFSYGRLLCIAFDLAIIRAYLKDPFPHFVYHDGILETLDDRKKMLLIDVSREYCKLGVQHIITVIDSELPLLSNGKRFAFAKEEVIMSLSDEGDNGRLFKMPQW